MVMSVHVVRRAVRVLAAALLGYAVWLTARGYLQQTADKKRFRDAYEFVVANGQITRALPCGCKAGDHSSLDMCFISRRDKNDRVLATDPHAETCPICVDVALIAARLHAQGADTGTILRAVEARYRANTPDSLHNR